MQTQKNSDAPGLGLQKPSSLDPKEFLQGLSTLSDSEISRRVVDCQDLEKVVRELPPEDFFWLVKKLGDDECLPLLQLASTEQRQYLLDLQIWKKDRLDPTQTSLWMKRFEQADSGQLVKWLFSEEGETFAHLFFFKTLEVVVLDSDETVLDLPDGYFTLDGVFHIKIMDPENQEFMENVFRVMATEDLNRYQALLLGLSAVLPSELEESLYRLRNVRLAEHGFLPYEEAISVYAPLDPEVVKGGKSRALLQVIVNEETRSMVPVSPLFHTGAQSMLTKTVSGIRDPLLLDRIRLEFAGLCNQILSADGLLDHEFEDLIKTCRKAAGYVNLALESLCGSGVAEVEQFLKNHSLLSLFRVGFGLALKVKWEGERWAKESWFHGRGLGTEFWGDDWGGTLAGILAKRPRFHVGPQESEAFRDFEWLSDLAECMDVLRRLMVLDSLMERLATRYPPSEDLLTSSEVTFHPLLFSLWGRSLLELEPSFSGISLKQAKDLFGKLRSGSRTPPFRMSGYKEAFSKYFMAYATDSDPEAALVLKETLSNLWQAFEKEYEWISTGDLDARYSKFIPILK